MDHPFASRIGRRTLVLLFFGFLWMLVGVGVLLGPADRFSRPGATGELLEIMDHPHWGWMWLAFGLMAVISGVLRRRARMLDEWGFNSLLIPVGTWTLAFLWSAVAFVASNGEFGQARSWFGAVVYGVMTLAVLVIAGWPDPSDERLLVKEA